MHSRNSSFVLQWTLCGIVFGLWPCIGSYSRDLYFYSWIYGLCLLQLWSRLIIVRRVHSLFGLHVIDELHVLRFFTFCLSQKLGVNMKAPSEETSLLQPGHTSITTLSKPMVDPTLAQPPPPAAAIPAQGTPVSSVTTLTEPVNPAMAGLPPDAWAHLQSQALQLPHEGPRDVPQPSVAMVSWCCMIWPKPSAQFCSSSHLFTLARSTSAKLLTAREVYVNCIVVSEIIMVYGLLTSNLFASLFIAWFKVQTAVPAVFPVWSPLFANISYQWISIQLASGVVFAVGCTFRVIFKNSKYM